jgi:hypothetical protein
MRRFKSLEINDMVNGKKAATYHHNKYINALFESIAQNYPADCSEDAAWLAELKREALNRGVGWKRNLQGYLRGAQKAKPLPADELAALQSNLLLAREGGPSNKDLMWGASWLLAVAAAYSYFRLLDFLAMTIASVMLAILGTIWCARRVGRNEWRKDGEILRPQKKWVLPVEILSGMFLVTAGAITLPITVGLGTEYYSKKHFAALRDAFEKDPNGFPIMNQFAKTNFDVDLILGSDEASWAWTTTLLLPRSSSPASVTVDSGYCTLNFNSENVLSLMPNTDIEDQNYWLRGVVVHELGHCLDVSRDHPKVGDHKVTTHSIAPSDAKNVSEVRTFVAASEQASTKKWREAVADIFAVGYWRVTAPSQSDRLVSSLRKFRKDGAEGDRVHDTTCWIDYAAEAEAPVSAKDLFIWADRLRSAAPCTPELSDGGS